jgi:formamidopyrimidine-DNA glycosylase
MPELPDIVVYLDALRSHILGQRLEAVRIGSPFVLRSVDPPLADATGRKVTGLRRLGKRIVIGFESDLYLVIHLMIAGRLRWKRPRAAIPGRIGLAAFDFPTGTLLFTEAGTRRRAALYVARGEAGLAEHERGGLEVLEADAATFRAALRRENHTLKRALTDPRLVSGIGNAYSDEILHAAKLSPFTLTATASDAELDRLYGATRTTLTAWIERLRAEVGKGFPDKVTAFHEAMAVHGRYRKPCPVCGSPVQRVRYAENEMNYCATCQTSGKVFADRSLSRLLKDDWPRSLDEWEERMASPPDPLSAHGEGERERD